MYRRVVGLPDCWLLFEVSSACRTFQRCPSNDRPINVFIRIPLLNVIFPPSPYYRYECHAELPRTVFLLVFALSTPRYAPTPLLFACSFRVILDIPLSIFLTMFGFPADYLHSDDLHKLIKTAEKKKATIRRAPSEFSGFLPSLLFHVFRSGHVLLYGRQPCFHASRAVP